MDKNIVTEAFTELSSNYEETVDRELNQFWGISYQAFVEKMLVTATIESGEKVLDIATGTAVIPLNLKSKLDHDDRIVGLDITPAMLAKARKDILISGNEKEIDLVCASAMCMPFANGVFHVVICGLGTHHMDVPLMLLEAKRMLANGGRLIICDVSANLFWRSSFGKIILRLLLILYGFVNQSARSQAEIEAFKNVRTPQEWFDLLSEFGFSNIHVKEVKPRLPWFPSGVALSAEIGF